MSDTPRSLSLPRTFVIVVLTAALLVCIVLSAMYETAPGDSVEQWRKENPQSTEQHFVNINTASEERLMLLDGMDRGKTRAILEYRSRFVRFTSVEELLLLPEISEVDLERWRPYITVN